MSTSSSRSARTPVAGCIARLRPSSPDSSPRPLRRRKSGVAIAPPAAPEGARPNGPRAPALHLDAPGAAALVRRGAGVPGERHVGEAHVLLGRGGAAEGADARAHAAAHVAVEEVARPAEAVGAAL